MAKNEIKNAEAVEETKAPAVEETKDPEVKAPEVKMEEIFVPKGYVNDEPNLLISVNGNNFLLPRGKTSTVPYYIAEEYRRSQKAQAIMDEHIDNMLGASK